MATVRAGVVFTLMGGLFLMSTAGLALAGGTDFDDYSSQVSARTDSMPVIVTYISYIAGAGLAALGIVDLKKHVENPSQTPLKNGLAKTGFGGALLAFPTLASMAQTTADNGGAGVYQDFGDRPTVTP
jgi:hypothetical protein